MKIKRLYAIVLLQVFRWQFKVEIDHEKKVFSVEFAGDNPCLTISDFVKTDKDEEMNLAINYIGKKFSNYKLLKS